MVVFRFQSSADLVFPFQFNSSYAACGNGCISVGGRFSVSCDIFLSNWMRGYELCDSPPLCFHLNSIFFFVSITPFLCKTYLLQTWQWGVQENDDLVFLFSLFSWWKTWLNTTSKYCTFCHLLLFCLSRYSLFVSQRSNQCKAGFKSSAHVWTSVEELFSYVLLNILQNKTSVDWDGKGNPEDSSGYWETQPKITALLFYRRHATAHRFFF